jgi:hypothetical protein
MSQMPPSAHKSGPLKHILNNLNAPERDDLDDGAKPGNLGKKSDHHETDKKDSHHQKVLEIFSSSSSDSEFDWSGDEGIEKIAQTERTIASAPSKGSSNANGEEECQTKESSKKENFGQNCIG